MDDLISADAGLTATGGRFTFGPALHVGLPHRFGADLELLYKRMDFGFEAEPSRAVVHRLELPLLVRYVFSTSRVHPWLHAGMSFNRVIAVNGATLCALGPFGEEYYCVEGKTAAVLRHQHTHGPVLGAGLEYRWKRVLMLPEIRVTRWVDRNFGTQDSALRSNLLQVELLFGLRF